MSKRMKPQARPATASAAAPRWYDIKAAAPAEGEATRADIFIYGDIGESWWDETTTAKDLVPQIVALDVDTIDLHINSFGGSVTDGMAIYNALQRHRAAVNVFVDGVAISCASYIAMAGDTITMAKNAQMMIHAPWTYAGGNAVDLRDQADILDRYAKAMAHAYADKSGKPYEDALALLQDGQDHWFLADEALAEGFADAVGEEQDVAAALAHSFDLSRFQPGAPRASARRIFSQPAAAAATPKEPQVPMPKEPAAENTAPIQAAAPVAPFARTKDDNVQVLAMFKPFAHQAGIAALQTEVLADPSLTLDAIQAKLLAKLGEGVEPLTPQNAHPHIETVQDETARARARAADAILAKAGVITDRDARIKATQGNPYMSMRLTEIARDSLTRAGIKTHGMDSMALVAAAFTQGTSDFPILLENAMHKALQRAYDLQPTTWQRFCATSTVSDFRVNNRYRVGSFGNLNTVNELAEYINKTIPDGEKATIQASTKGNIINLSRQAIINDDLGAFVGLAASLGRAARRTVEQDVYDLINANSGMGPTMSGTPMFDAGRSNTGSDGALDVAVMGSLAAAMKSQKDVSGNDYLDLVPYVFVCHPKQGPAARMLNESQYDPSGSANQHVPNLVRGMFTDIVESPRITGNSNSRVYVFADPNVAPAFEVAFLDGQQDPYLERQEGFDVDGSRFKVRLDYGVAAIDWRGAATAKGTA